jgi:alkylhydroperoxidase family enzyme
MNGFTPEQILQIRSGQAPFDNKLNALAEFTLATVKNRGKVNPTSKDAFFEAGYTEANLIDIVMNIGDKIMSNFIHNIGGFPIDFPLAQPLKKAA